MNRRHSSSRPSSSRSRAQVNAARGRLRLIGGRFKRRLLPVLDSPGLRPTPDRVRETLFNWLAFDVAGQRVLDLYAGSGALGLEALSRGAAHAIFVEQQRAVAQQLRDNLATLGLTTHMPSASSDTQEAEATLVEQDALDYLDVPARYPFDVVFLDPPFHKGLAEKSCARLEANGWLAPEAMIYVEVESSLMLEVPDTWQLHRQTRAGESHAYLYRRLPLAQLSPGA
ncbi:16S rRNA (guanine(966)-N(2))-methyltransferase RsmD [Phytohalomonas tamaricis]|uniref:16S rRNA (guanine(966)-N(2))-methyltransferase RsmD n=1 Tax=Phytohalomonas tamaricis TaxID=2081032 RepID=UPI000D0B11F6|nr:16S rRNA (guanine(966)-N(2))-methyltransferase RsmD [Phytohalomonas tamaricis]